MRPLLSRKDAVLKNRRLDGILKLIVVCVRSLLAAAGRQLELKQNKVELVYTLSSLLLLLLPRTFFNCKLFPKTPFAITQFIFSSSC